MKKQWNTYGVRSGLMTWLVFMVILSGCGGAPPIADGEVVSIWHGFSRLVMQDAITGRVGTEIFVKEGYVLFAKATEQGMAFVAINTEELSSAKVCDIVTCGNIVNIKTWGEFRQWLVEEQGWTAQIIPLAVRIGKWAAEQATRLQPTIFVIPAGIDAPSALDVLGFEEGIDQ
jgi:hypothetical protein